MKQFKYILIDIFLPLAIFIVPQMLLSLLGRMLYENCNLDFGGAIGFILIATSLFTICILILLRCIVLKNEFSIQQIRWKLVSIVFLATMAGFFTFNVFTEWMNLENPAEETLKAIATNGYGIIAISLLGPITEELVFRSSILGGMLRRGIKPMSALIISSFIFAIVHINPAQMFFAFVSGLMFGIIYLKSKSVVLSCGLHIINNSVSVALINYYIDQPDMTITKAIDNHALLVTLTSCLLGLCIGGYIWYCRKIKTN